jgi:quercetin dioxygenase-like cupin family protein
MGAIREWMDKEIAGMKTFNLFENLEFKQDPNEGLAEPLHVSDTGRVLRFTFRPGQSIPKADSPSSPMFYIVLKGQAIFSDAGGREQSMGPNTLVIYEPGEEFKVRAGNEEVVMLAVMRETDMARRESARSDTGTAR